MSENKNQQISFEQLQEAYFAYRSVFEVIKQVLPDDFSDNEQWVNGDLIERIEMLKENVVRISKENKELIEKVDFFTKFKVQ